MQLKLTRIPPLFSDGRGSSVSTGLAAVFTLLTLLVFLSAPARGDSARGKYLVEALMACDNCHTPRGPDGYQMNLRFSGGSQVFSEKDYKVRGSNISPDEQTGIGSWSDQQIRAAIIDGVSPTARLAPVMPSESYRVLTPKDLDATIGFLRAASPVKSNHPEQQKQGALEPRPPIPGAEAPFTDADVSDGYRRVERIALVIGMCEGAFFVVAWFSHPNAQTILRDVTNIPFRDREFLYLASATIGAVLNTWMVFYQQSAVVDRKLGPADYKVARIDTAIGAVVAQLLTAAVLVAVAATLGARENHVDIHSVGEISEALTPVLGERLGSLVFAVGVLGASSVAAIVSALALVWGLSEVTGHRHSFEHHPLRARWFFGLFCLLVSGCVVLVVRVHDLIWLNIGMQVLSAILLPMVIALLVLAAVKALPEAHKPRGLYLWTLIASSILVSGVGLVGGLLGLLS